MPVDSFGSDFEELAAFDDETFEVGAEHDLLHEPTEWPEWGIERDAIDHHRADIGRAELVLVMEPAKRSPCLLVDEAVRSLECRDAAGHGEGNVKVRRSPGHLLAKPDLPGGDPSDGPLVGRCLRIDMRVDVEREIEDDRWRSRDGGDRFEGDRHDLSLSRQRTRFPERGIRQPC